MDAELKQRLVGASVIIALAIIFIPMIFDDSKVTQNQTITIEIPDEPNDLKHKVLSIDSAQPPMSTESSENESNNHIVNETNLDNQSQPVVKKQETIIDVVDNSHKPIKDTVPVVEKSIDSSNDKAISKSTNEVIAQDVTKPTKEILTNSNDTTNQTGNLFRVKYGAFSKQKNAQQLKAKIINAGFDAIVEKDKEKGVYKVRSGFLESKQAAQKLTSQIEKLKLNIGKPGIETLTEEQVVAAQALLNTGWIVQIGIFSSKQNSIKLRNKIRSKGFVAFVDEIKNSKNQNLYRVRVGPFATRKEADGSKTQIKQKMNLKGLLKPHEKQKVVN